jgi:hypothetical protein
LIIPVRWKRTPAKSAIQCGPNGNKLLPSPLHSEFFGIAKLREKG